MQPQDYVNRGTYRRRADRSGLVSYTVSIAESDLQISTVRKLDGEARNALRRVRRQIESYISGRSEFGDSLVPVGDDPDADPIVRSMIRAGQRAGTGPMAAVAGAVAEFVGRSLVSRSPEVIVENGGDVFMVSSIERVVAVFAGDSELSMKLGIRIPPAPEGLGVCTSSGKVGPSLSRGRADAAVCLSEDAALADAAATELGNRVGSSEDLQAAISWVQSVEGIDGALAISGEDLAAWGEIELVEI